MPSGCVCVCLYVCLCVCAVVILAEDAGIANLLSQHGIQVQTLSETHPIQVHPARILSQIFSRLGMWSHGAPCHC